MGFFFFFLIKMIKYKFLPSKPVQGQKPLSHKYYNKIGLIMAASIESSKRKVNCCAK